MIRVCFSTTNNPFSKLIRWITKSKVSHCFISFYVEYLDVELVLEAGLFGYKLSQAKKWESKKIVISKFSCKKDLSEALKLIIKDLDEEYDIASIFGLVLRRWFGKKYKNPFRNADKLQCSEAMAKFLQYANYAKEFDPESTVPEDLYEYCLKNKDFEQCM